MSERRYNDEEVEAIFRTASDDRRIVERQSSRDEGLTLADLQTIGLEAGISPDAVARAARGLAVRVPSSQRRFLGLPISVARTIELDRRMSDDEWERLVVHLREVFHARGSVRSEGSLKQWTNGNLHVLLEPTSAGGHRLRFGTYNGAAQASITAGLASLAAMVLALVASAGGGLAGVTPSMAILGVAGVGLIANGALRLPRWARLRGRQMEALAAEAASATEEGRASEASELSDDRGAS